MSSCELNGVDSPGPGVQLDAANDCVMEEPAVDVPVKALPQSDTGMDVDGVAEQEDPVEKSEVESAADSRVVEDRETGEVTGEVVVREDTKTDTVNSNGSCRSDSPAMSVEVAAPRSQDSHSIADDTSEMEEESAVEAETVPHSASVSSSPPSSPAVDSTEAADEVSKATEGSDESAVKASAEDSDAVKHPAEDDDLTKDSSEDSEETETTADISEDTNNSAKQPAEASQLTNDSTKTCDDTINTAEVTKDSSLVFEPTEAIAKTSEAAKDTAKVLEPTEKKVDKQSMSQSNSSVSGSALSTVGTRTALTSGSNSTIPSVSLQNNSHNITINSYARSESHHHHQPSSFHSSQQQQQHRVGGAAMAISGNVLSALAQYGITTGGMSAEQLQQLHEYYRRSQNDTEFILEAPSFIVPYVRESPAQQTAKQMLAEMSVAGGSGEGGDSASKAEEQQQSADDKVKPKTEQKDGETDNDAVQGADSQKSSSTAAVSSSPTSAADANKENKPASSAGVESSSGKREQEDYTHLGKWAYYYQGAVGEFVLDQGRSIVEEFIKEDLLKQQRRKAVRERSGGSEATRFAIRSLTANLAASRERNAPFRLHKSQCRYCAFESESTLAMERHLEIPHTVGSIFQCNFCEFESRSHQAILSHMSGDHNVSARLERAPGVFQCPLCPYEDSGKARMARHINGCQKKFRTDRNQALEDWTPPAKVPRIHRGRPNVLGKQFEPVRGAGQVAMPIPSPYSSPAGGPASVRARGRPVGSYKDASPSPLNSPQLMSHGRGGMLGSGTSPVSFLGRGTGGPRQLTPGALAAAGMHMSRHSSPSHYQIGNQMYQLVSNQLVPVSGSGSGGRSNNSGLHITSSALPSGITIQPSSKSGLISSPSASAAAAAATLKLSSSPSISITPVPRPTLPANVPSLLRSGAGAAGHVSISRVPAAPGAKQGPTQQTQQLNKGSFVICEICDGYIKDLEQLRNHMQWIHKVKIHPKMIFNRPPLNCQKCQLRFFTDQGLERHLLGSHGLVTSTMQEAANRGQDSGRCPVCGRVFQCKLLQHVARDHRVILKPAHLSYKCTVCTATFGMYKQFENHVYSTHSIVAKKIMESSDRRGKTTPSGGTHSGSGGGSANTSASKSYSTPIRINDQITVIPQAASNNSADT